MLGSRFETHVCIPRDLWPQAWKDKGMLAPCCKLNKSFYCHPEAGGHWERHLHKAIQWCGGVAIANHPSAYWIEEVRLFLTVYVDDLLLNGHEAAHDPFGSCSRPEASTLTHQRTLIGSLVGLTFLCSACTCAVLFSSYKEYLLHYILRITWHRPTPCYG